MIEHKLATIFYFESFINKVNNSHTYNILFSSECTNKGGTAAGSCASGFGVCCTCKNLFSFFKCLFSLFLSFT
jgi:hypothetical protein